MNWWLKLYTIPFMRTASFLMLGTFLLDFLLTKIPGVSIPGHYLIFACIILLIHFTKDDSFRMNIEFHKMSVPYKLLRKAFLLHSLLQYLFLLVLSLVFYGVSHLMGGAFYKTQLPSPSIILAIICSGFFIWIWGQMFLNPEKRYYVLTKNHTFLQRILVIGLEFSTFLFIYYILESLKLSYFLGLPLIFLSLSLSIGLFGLKAMFHQASEHANFFHTLKFNFVGIGITFCLFFLFSLVGKYDLSNQSLSPEQRLQSFMTWQPTTGKLDQASFMEFEDLVTETLDAYVLYQTVEPSALEAIPASYFIDPKRPDKLYFFLTLSQNIHPNQLVGILDYLVDHKGFLKDPKKEEFFYHTAIMRWQDGAVFPERHLAAQKKWNELQQKREIASQPKED